MKSSILAPGLVEIIFANAEKTPKTLISNFSFQMAYQGDAHTRDAHTVARRAFDVDCACASNFNAHFAHF